MKVPAPVKQLRAQLKAWPEATRVGHAYARVDMDETEPMPKMLSFHYRGAQFFARVHDEKARLEIPTNRLTNPTLGFVVVSSDTLIEEIQGYLDPAICTPIQLTEFGDRLVFDAGQSDEDPLGRFAFASHEHCGSGIDRTPISKTHQVLHCRSCNLRVPIPLWCTQIGDLRRWVQEEKT